MAKKQRDFNLSNNDLSLKVADDSLERMTREGSKNIEFAFSKVIDLRADLSVLEVAIGAALSLSRMLAKKRDRLFAEGQVKLAELTGKNSSLSVGTELLVRISPEAAGMVGADLMRCGLNLSYKTGRWVEFRGVASSDMVRSIVGPYGGEVIELPPFRQSESQGKPGLDISHGQTEETGYMRGVEGSAQASVLQEMRPEMPERGASPRQTAPQEAALQQDQTQVQDTPEPFRDNPKAPVTNRSGQDAESEKTDRATGIEDHEAAPRQPFDTSGGTRVTPVMGPRRLPHPATEFHLNEVSRGKPMDLDRLGAPAPDDYQPPGQS